MYVHMWLGVGGYTGNSVHVVYYTLCIYSSVQFRGQPLFITQGMQCFDEV